MRAAWDPGASSAACVGIPGEGSSGSGCSPATLTRKRESMPAQGSAVTTEVQQLRAEIFQLRVASQSDARDRETMQATIERLKMELSQAWEDNRVLTERLEERKQHEVEASVRREAAARESALKSAKELFKSMLNSPEGNRGSIENRNSNRTEQQSTFTKQRSVLPTQAVRSSRQIPPGADC